ncbi:hypothetical protein D3C81_1104410 [compost metagenome]
MVQVAHEDAGAALVALPQVFQFGLGQFQEVTAVEDLGQAVGGGEFVQFGFDPLALGDVGDEAVPEDAAILQQRRPGISQAPAGALLRQADAIFQMPGRQAGGGGFQRGSVDGEVVRVNQAVDGRAAGRHLVRADFVDVLDAGAGIGEEGLPVGHPPQLEDHAGNLVGKVGQQVGGLLLVLGEAAQRSDVSGGADHAQRPAFAVAADHLAAAAHPLVAAVLAADAVLHLVDAGALLEVRLHGRPHVVEVGGMDARVAFLDAIADFGVGVPQQRLPAAGVMDQVARDIAVPDAGAAAGDGERHAPLAFAQRVRPYAQPRRGLVAIDGHRRKDGELPQVGALVGVEVARLIVEQTETADPLAIAAKQWATGMEAREGRLVQPGLSGKARVCLQVGDHQDFLVIAR